MPKCIIGAVGEAESMIREEAGSILDQSHVEFVYLPNEDTGNVQVQEKFRSELKTCDLFFLVVSVESEQSPWLKIALQWMLNHAPDRIACFVFGSADPAEMDLRLLESKIAPIQSGNVQEILKIELERRFPLPENAPTARDRSNSGDEEEDSSAESQSAPPTTSKQKPVLLWTVILLLVGVIIFLIATGQQENSKEGDTAQSGKTSILQHELELNLAQAKTILERDPENIEALIQYGEVLYHNGRDLEAIGYLEKARDNSSKQGLPPDERILIPLVACYSKTGQKEKATGLFEELINEKPLYGYDEYTRLKDKSAMSRTEAFQQVQKDSQEIVMKSRIRRLDRSDMTKIARQIWENECDGKVEGLTSWNKGERFASMGIGHFIWFPKGVEEPYHESFPELMNYFQKRGVNIPDWMTKDCPWPNREVFMAHRQSESMKQLQQFFVDTIQYQAEFMYTRAEAGFPQILSQADPGLRDHLEEQFYRLVNHRNGVYVLVDYVNFKGEGTNPKERYQGIGWGLLQVLERMKGKEPGFSAVKEFADQAYQVLERRARNAPPGKDEERWLRGWRNRLNTYTNF